MKLDFNSHNSLKQPCAGRQVTPLLLLDAGGGVYSRKAENANFIVSCFTQPRANP